MGLFDKLKAASSGTELPPPGATPKAADKPTPKPKPTPAPAAKTADELPQPGVTPTPTGGAEITGLVPCPQCDGKGHVQDDKGAIACGLCKGTGKVTQEIADKMAAIPGGKTSTPAPAETKTPAPSSEIAQCMCGAHIEGECPACNGDPDLLANLQSIGDAAGVNPPAPDKADPAPETTPAPPETAPTPAVDDGLTACPYCGKRFKHLTRHKCKVQPEGAPTPAEAVKAGMVYGETPPETTPADETETPRPEPGQGRADVGTAPMVPAADDPPLPVPGDPAATSQGLRDVHPGGKGDTGAPESAPKAPETKTPATVPPEAPEPTVPTETPQDDAPVPTDMANTGDGAPAGAQAEREPFILLLNAIPVKGAESVDFNDWIAPLADKVAAKFEVPHWGLVNFGKGPHALAALVDMTLKDHPLSGVMTVNTFATEAKACLSVLTRHADITIMGV